MDEHSPTRQHPDTKAFERVFQQRATLIKRFAKQYQEHLGYEIVEDVVDQSLLIAVRKYRGSFDNQKHLASFLNEVCKNEIFQLFKKNGQTLSLSLNTMTDCESASPSNPAELHEQREIIKKAIQNIRAISNPDELKLFREQINYALDGKQISRSSVQEKYGWSQSKLNQMTVSLNSKIRLVKAQVLSLPLFLWGLSRKLRGQTSNAEAATVASTTAGGAIISMKALPVLLVVTTAAGGGVMIYKNGRSASKKPQMTGEQQQKPQQATPPASAQTPVVLNKQSSHHKKALNRKTRKRKHKRRYKSRHAAKKSFPPPKTPSQTSTQAQQTQPVPASKPSTPSPSSPSPSSRGEGDAEFGVDP